MSKIFTILVVMLICGSALLYAQNREIWVNEDFSGTFPPDGWTISANATNWSQVAGAAAGGTAPEVRFSWSPRFNNSTYFISPQFNTTGETTLYLDFDHFVDWYANPFTIGVATRSNNGAWNVAWSQNPTANIGPETKTVTITTTDVGSDVFQFALYFIGDSYNIDYWYIDNVKLYTYFAYDLGIMSVGGEEHYQTGASLIPTCVVKNVGLNSLTATVSLDIYQNQTLVQSYPDYFGQALAPQEVVTASFPNFTFTQANELYKFNFNVTSLEDVPDGDPTNNNAEKYFNTWTSAKQNVLLEIGTGAWCTYCPGAAMAADDFVEGDYNVAVIENHNGDPYATDTSDGRNNYYGISGFPTGIFDGLLSYVGGNHTTSVFPAYLPLYQQRVNIKTPINIYLYGSNEDRMYNINAKIDKLANLAYPNLVLHFALTESHIQYAWQGQTELNFVNRLMVPDMYGTTVDLQNAPLGLMNVPLNFNFDAAWNIAQCELVAFVQNLDTKEVLQAYKVALTDLPIDPVANDDNIAPVLLTELHQNFPNPFNPETTIRYTVKESVPVLVEIYNQKGQLVKTLVNETKAAGDYKLVWNGTDQNGSTVASGVYYFKMNSGKFSSTKKMILMK